MVKPQLSIDGQIISGKEVRDQNVTAVVAVANVIRSSLGPEGLDKMLVDDIGDVVISNDGATILQRLDVEHPAAKVLVDLAELQDSEVGDGTTSVVLIAADLLRRANMLIGRHIHPTTVISGFRLAQREACRYIKDVLATTSDTLTRESLIGIAKTSMSSKIIGAESDFFSKLAVDAMLRVKSTNSRGVTRYPLKSVNVLACHGKSIRETQFIEGYALNCTISSQAMPKRINNAKVACLDFGLSKDKLAFGVNIVVTDPDKLEDIRRRESDILKEKIELILASGANVILTTKGMDDMAMKYLVEAGAIGVRRVLKSDLRQIAKATGAKIKLSLGVMDEGDKFPAEELGECEVFEQIRVSDKELCVVRNCKNTRTSSVILRGPNEYTLGEMERSLHDALCVIKRALELKSIVPGGGAVETALSIYLENFANTLGSREQLAVAEFAEALLVIPKTLAVNAAQDTTDMLAKLRAAHAAAQKDEAKRGMRQYGLDLAKGEVVDNLKAGVIEPAMSKFATEAAVTILRIDDLITLNPKEEPQRGGH